MKTWSIGTNSYFYTASIYLEEVPFYLPILESIAARICDFLVWIPIPKYPEIVIRKKDIETGEMIKSTLKEWYNDFGTLFHMYVCMPLCDYIHKKTKRHVIEFPYNRALEMVDGRGEYEYESYSKEREIYRERSWRFSMEYSKLEQMMRSHYVTKE